MEEGREEGGEREGGEREGGERGAMVQNSLWSV